MKEQKPQITHLFRPVNLAIIVITMYFLRNFLLIPVLNMVGGMVEVEMESQISEFWFFMLVLSVISIAIGGYILNDHEDVNEDAINHGKNPVGTLISRESAYRLYMGFTIFGIILGFIVGYQLGNYNLGILQLAVAITLWFYSNYFKSSPLIGNILVAFVVAMVPLTVGIYEVTQIQIFYFKKVTVVQDFNFNFIAYWFIGYTLFAFFLTLIREIIKDVEDVEGDRQVGAQTFPVVYGKKAGNILATLLYIGVAAALLYVQQNFLVDKISRTFIMIIIMFIAINCLGIWKKNGVLLKSSTWSKIISVMGVIYLVALKYIIENELFFNV